MLACSIAAPAAAEVGATFSIFSDDRFRGYSLSDGRPVGTFDFAYDDSSGFYADAAATGVIRQGSPSALGAQFNGGFAKQLKSGTTLDFGIIYSSYSHYSQGGGRKSYGEIYAGIARGAFSSRIFLSPHYSEAGLWTTYGEINANISPARKWSIDAHAGILLPLRNPDADENYRPAFDARLGITRELGPLSLHASWVLGEHGREYYGDGARGGSAFILGATWAL
ncbi:MAG TPA: TorF family putative porin [Sphingomicrobium sp.]|jgi:uncharacterized protein (TIGR02001 family)|nr:TorF family putative porin [Sphingomicrobium sp.]